MTNNKFPSTEGWRGATGWLCRAQVKGHRAQKRSVISGQLKINPHKKFPSTEGWTPKADGVVTARSPHGEGGSEADGVVVTEYLI